MPSTPEADLERKRAFVHRERKEVSVRVRVRVRVIIRTRVFAHTRASVRVCRGKVQCVRACCANPNEVWKFV